MNEFRADLHCHSTCSDGTHTPKQLIELAKETGLSGLSITDHDTIEAYDTIMEYAARLGIDLISGVEFSCVHNGSSVHILGYAYATRNEKIREFCELHKKRRKRRYLAILDLLTKSGMPLSEEELKCQTSGASIGRPHIALAMMEKGYVKSVDEAFKKYIGDGKPCYVKGEAFPVEETIDIIHNAGGIAVIAHPHLIKKTAIVRDLLEMNFDGLEGYYAKFDRETDHRWVGIAKSKNWLVTGGSDFHGDVKPHIQLGCSWVNKDTFQIIKQRFLESQNLT